MSCRSLLANYWPASGKPVPGHRPPDPGLTPEGRPTRPWALGLRPQRFLLLAGTRRRWPSMKRFAGPLVIERWSLRT
ncbi:hypothetical protein ElyMa_002246300 [Elysia marginata]|uniref:Uncharacterized protein n=1 Tax=Elysia marginata TaxID=1093978 RepID=A0AAV4FWT1_9GAST|nr:hypothetical protein ElyMa_002246300 [Elysia marginata]